MKKLDTQQKRWVGIVAVLLAVILALGITLGVATKWGKDLDNLTPKQEETAVGNVGGGMVVGESEETGDSGLSLLSAEIPVAQYEEYGIAPIAESAISVTVKIEGENVDDLKVDWTLSWESGTDGSFGEGREVSSYVSGIATEDTHTYNLSCLDRFRETIILTAALHDFPDKTATRRVEYAPTFVTDVSGKRRLYFTVRSASDSLTDRLFTYTSSQYLFDNGGEKSYFYGIAFPQNAGNSYESFMEWKRGENLSENSVETAFQFYKGSIPITTITDLEVAIKYGTAYKNALEAAGGSLSGTGYESGDYKVVFSASSLSVQDVVSESDAGTASGRIICNFGDTFKSTDFFPVGSTPFDLLKFKSELKTKASLNTTLKDYQYSTFEDVPDVIKIRLKIKINGTAYQEEFFGIFLSEKFGSLPTSLGWSDDGGAVVFGRE